MKKFAAVFPGQGSQSVGMFADFMDNEIVAKTYEEANAALGYDLKDITLNGPEAELNKTEVTQPAILTASVAAYRVLEAKGFKPEAVAGHSLGEYSALVAAGVISFADAVKLVRLRGKAMQEAVPAGVGAMAAVLGLEDQVIVDVCNEVSTEDDKVWAANFNTPGQVVISGNKGAVDRALEQFTAKGAKRVVPLAVSAPSHCPLMQKAADVLKAELSKIQINDASIPVYVNVLAKPLTKKEEIIDALVKQLTMPVRWVETVNQLKADGVEALIEVGPNKVLCGLNRRIDKTLGSANICNEETLAKALEVIA
ncbi:MAG: ACP S-malonyltransferase [Succinivibrio sp.]|uniref:Malonyl CoA-acyl carrier protein transacylase n=1 Tax=Succinivibrio faecicola TaxID=2820300 RepID=A0ABS7DGX9_9GAMM|nr:ACP S-malonyltransferase [Succinivibrio faecicola]MBW7570329.1 ACP S-malonyltransferase [Succinivibrio faecicola]MCI6939345.1 ACP S-malonyltransferase [Succinatimonas hippei]